MIAEIINFSSFNAASSTENFFEAKLYPLFEIDFLKIAKACGYERVLKVTNAKKLISAIDSIFMEDKCSFLEIRTNTNYRKEIGRPKETPHENKEKFINFLNMKSK